MLRSCSLGFLHTGQVCAWLSNSTHPELCEKCSFSWITPPPSGRCSWLWRCQGQTCDQTSLVPPSTELQTSPPPPGGTRMSDRIHSNDKTLCTRSEEPLPHRFQGSTWLISPVVPERSWGGRKAGSRCRCGWWRQSPATWRLPSCTHSAVQWSRGAPLDSTTWDRCRRWGWSAFGWGDRTCS